MKLSLALLGATAAVVLSAGCGGDSDPAEPAASTASRAYGDEDLLFVRGGAEGGILLLTDDEESHLGEGGAVAAPRNVRRVAFTRGRGESHKEICIAAVMKRELTDLACNIDGANPAWNANGTQLAYTRDGVWIVSYPDGEPERVAGPDYEGELAWSPDGRYLLIRRAGAPVSILNLSTRDVQEVAATGGASAATWHPVTGELTIALRRDGERASVSSHPWPSGAVRTLFTVDGGVAELNWTTDGRYLAYTHVPPATTSDVVDDLGGEEILVYGTASRTHDRVTDNSVADFGPVWLSSS